MSFEGIRVELGRTDDDGGGEGPSFLGGGVGAVV